MGTAQIYRKPDPEPWEHLVAVIVLMVLFSSCSPRMTEHLRTEYRAVTDYQHDTLWRDRVVTVREKGDTVRITETEYVYKTLWKTRTDTVAVHDTTSVERVREVRVEKPLTAAQKFKIGVFWWLFILCAIGFRREIGSIIKIFL